MRGTFGRRERIKQWNWPKRGEIDAAVLDVNIRSERVDSVAAILRRRRITEVIIPPPMPDHQRQDGIPRRTKWSPVEAIYERDTAGQ